MTHEAAPYSDDLSYLEESEIGTEPSTGTSVAPNNNSAIIDLDEYRRFKGRGLEFGESGLTPEEEKLFKRYYLLVEAIARKMVVGKNGPCDALEEARSNGYEGLLKAMQKFDPERVNKEATTNTRYFGKFIQQAIYIGWRSRYGRIYKEENENGSIKIVKVLSLGVMVNTAASLDRPVSSNGNGITDTTFGETLSLEQLTDNTLEDSFFEKDIKPTLAKFSERDQAIFRMFIFEDQTKAQIAKIVGCSAMNVGRRLSKMYEVIKSEMGYES
jgi:RNA polymerase sigma factor (sigma-70 family)